MRILIDEHRLQVRISEMAREIDEYYLGQNWYQETQEPVVVIGVLTGAMFFMADLVRKLSIRVELDFIRVSTYPGKAIEAHEPTIITQPARDLYNAHVLLVDDILDTGKTLRIIRQNFTWPSPDTMQTAFLLRKHGKAQAHARSLVRQAIKSSELIPLEEDVTADFVGFNIPDEFVVGYGLDYNGRYREMSHVAVWSENES